MRNAPTPDIWKHDEIPSHRSHLGPLYVTHIDKSNTTWQGLPVINIVELSRPTRRQQLSACGSIIKSYGHPSHDNKNWSTALFYLLAWNKEITDQDTEYVLFMCLNIIKC